MELPPIVVVNGLPGSGKTTVARGLAARLPRAAWLEGDQLQHVMTVSGLVGPGEEPDDESWRQLDLRWRNLAALACNFVDAGFVAVVDSLLIPRHAEQFLAAVAPRAVGYVHLCPDRATGLARDAARTEKTIGDQFDWVGAEFAAFRGVGVWIDSTYQTPEQTVDEALTRLTNGAPLLG